MIDKELYFEGLDALKEYNDFENALYNTTNGAIDLLNVDPIQKVISVLQKVMEKDTSDEYDKHYGSNLSYFVYDLDFGNNWKEGMIIDGNGNDIPMRNKEDLWNYITSLNKT